VELPGAIVLAGIAALRAGAGKLELATCRTLTPAVGTAVPEALVTALPISRHGGIGATAAATIASHARAVDALLLGPGMMDQPAVDALVTALLRRRLAPNLILDAAPLVALRRSTLQAALRTSKSRVILTPHAGEMASLLDIPKDAVERAPRAIAEQAAAALDAVVVLKGSVTYIATPGTPTHCYTGGRVGLATSGSGDTLAGIIAGLVARGAEPARAACWGVYLHGQAGNLLAREVGPVGFLARELLDAVPRVMRGV